MEIAFHLGALCTDDGLLLKSLLRNAERLAERGVAIPGPSRYRDLLGEITTRFRGAVISDDSQEAILETILDSDTTRRVVLSSELFLSSPARSFYDGQFYPRAYKAGWLRNIFAGHAVSFHLAIRNPASFLPALWRRAGGAGQSFEDFLDGADPRALRWSEMVARLVEAAPGCPVTVWCNEDTPLIWGAVLRDVAGLDPDDPVSGDFDPLRNIMSHDGMKRLRAYTRAHPPATDTARRRVVAAFLSKFALEDAVEEVIDLPGWTGALIDELTELYDDDLAALLALPGVRVLTP